MPENDRITQKRAVILAAAMDVFAERGYHATKISDIAEKLSMGHGTFYRYFKNKLDIFTSVIDLVVAEIREVVRAEDPTGTNTKEEYRQQILRIGLRLYKVFMEDSRLAQILFYEALGVNQQLNERMDRVSELIDQHIELYLKNGIAKGFLDPDMDTRVVSKAVNALIFAGAKDIMFSEAPRATAEKWSEYIARLLLDGVSL